MFYPMCLQRLQHLIHEFILYIRSFQGESEEKSDEDKEKGEEGKDEEKEGEEKENEEKEDGDGKKSEQKKKKKKGNYYRERVNWTSENIKF